MTLTLEIVFWICAAVVGYVYIGYPLLVAAVAGMRRRPVRKSDFQPDITILIAAYNEEREIRKTIENKIGLEYPNGKLQVIVISDGSADRTDEIVREYGDQGVELIRQEPRAGKTSALNLAVPHARGEILVFSDANSIYAKDSLNVLARNFADPDVGYVTGKMVYVNPDGTPVGQGCSAFMRYENLLRKWETRVGSIVGVDGGIDAVRKELYRPMRPDQLPDFVLPLTVIEQGYRVVYEEGALLMEPALGRAREEYRMRVRVSLRALWALRDMAHLLNPIRFGLYSIEMLSHKLLRYAVFIFLLGLFAANALLLKAGLFYILAFACQSFFYLLALISWLCENQNFKLPIPFAPYYFSLLNVACAHAFVKFLRGEKTVIWTPRLG